MSHTTDNANSSKTYLPAAGIDLFLPCYDGIIRLIGADRVRRLLVEQGGFAAGQRVLDAGCGTGTLAVLLKWLYPEIDIMGIDPDPKALARARRKAEHSGVSVRFEQGYAESLDFPDGSFDRVLSSFMFHHLENEAKDGTLREIRRVLKPGGCLYLLDFGGVDSASGSVSRWLHSRHRLDENSDARMRGHLANAGFQDATIAGRGSALFGLLHAVCYRACKSR